MAAYMIMLAISFAISWWIAGVIIDVVTKSMKRNKGK